MSQFHLFNTDGAPTSTVSFVRVHSYIIPASVYSSFRLVDTRVSLALGSGSLVWVSGWIHQPHISNNCCANYAEIPIILNYIDSVPSLDNARSHIVCHFPVCYSISFRVDHVLGSVRAKLGSLFHLDIVVVSFVVYRSSL